ncbi:MAG: ribonuclease III [Clostridia bacterium]|nr:ribonuclease III [Clostridia bacterium]
MLEFDIKKIEKIIHYGFKNKDNLKTAFTHSSYANEHNIKSNQRLEYLGDSILNFVVAEYLYNNFDVEEGQMSKWRSKMVNSDNLANIIETLGLDKYIMLGKSFGKNEPAKSIKEDLFESLVGAIYIDSSIEKAKRFIFRFIDIKKSVKKKDVDYKSLLQEEVQKVKGANLVYFTYEVPRQPGNFCAEIYINDIFVARSNSTTKKQAQIDCAKLALSEKAKLKQIIKGE